MLWDTAGQEEFDAITKAYYRGKTSPPHPTHPLWYKYNTISEQIEYF